MTDVVHELDLREAWADLLRRRAAFAASLAVYGDILDRWATFPPVVTPLERGALDAHGLWERGLPLIADRPPSLPVDSV